ncbi:MAG: DEAD/DEAH box helicase [Gammaproteobacteria bacterium]|nr:DEAD/DEAH box helicase [Gammaproteobacteria bacterium]
MPFSLAQLQTIFASNAIDRGHRFIAANAVRSLQQRDGGKIVTAIVADSGAETPFRVYVRHSDQGEMQSECSCGQARCAHAAAALLKVIEQTNNTRTETTPTLDTGQSTASVAQPTDQQLLYILKPDNAITALLPVDTIVVRKLNHGAYTGGSRFSPERADKNNPARFLHTEDFEILANLARLGGCDSGPVLQSIIQTGRCHIENMHTPAVGLGDSRPVSLDWVTDQFGVQQLHWQVTPSAEYLFNVTPPWYLDPCRQVAGNLTSDLAQRLFRALLAQPTLAPESAKQLLKWIKSEFPQVQLPHLRAYETKSITAEPIACLRLLSIEVNSDWENKTCVHRAELFFTYDEVEVSAQTPATLFDGNALLHIQRNVQFEQQCKRRLLNAGFYSVPNKTLPTKDLYGLSGDTQQWVDFQYDTLPSFSEDHWQILYDPGFQLRAVRSQDWYCDTRRLENQDWFDFSMGVVIDDERVNVLPVLLDYLRHNPPEAEQETDTRYHILQIRDHQWLRVPTERIRTILNTLISLYAPKSAKTLPQSLRLPLYQLTSVNELTLAESAPVSDWFGDLELRSLGEALRGIDHAKAVASPPTLCTDLRHYQQTGLSWLQFLREQHMGGILADDMGLGKTVQTLAHLLLEKQHSRMDLPSLIIAPTSLVFNWRNELRRFAPSLSCLCLHGPKRQQHFKSISQHDVVITTYPLLIRDETTLQAFSYHYIILDEAHYIKNPKTKAARCVRKFDSRYKLCLTGTPLENHLGELWSLFDFLLPGLLGNQKQFQTVFRTPIEKHQDTRRAETLARRIRPFLLRRTKDEVAGELPPKTEIVRRIALTEQQQDLYETVRVSVHHQVRSVIQHQGLARSQITILDALLKLRQVCCDPRLVKLAKPHYATESAKLAFLIDILPEMIEEGRRILLFSQFTSMLTLIENEVKKIPLDYTKLTGQTVDRTAQIKRFQSGEVPLFLISLKAGGVGLNLTAADTVIHYDPWWNPAVERQATDRAHRIGQTQRVFVYKLICEGTVEEKILSMQQHKQSLADSLLQIQEPGAARWSEQEIDELLAPLE